MICTRRSMGEVAEAGGCEAGPGADDGGIHFGCRAPKGSKHKQKNEPVSCRKRSIDLKLAASRWSRCRWLGTGAVAGRDDPRSSKSTNFKSMALT